MTKYYNIRAPLSETGGRSAQRHTGSPNTDVLVIYLKSNLALVQIYMKTAGALCKFSVKTEKLHHISCRWFTSAGVQSFYRSKMAKKNK